MIPVLWVCGPPGVGKTAVAWEIYQRLERAGARAAYVDVDQLGICFPALPQDPDRHALKARNVGALRANFEAAGARVLIVSGVADATRGPDVAAIGGAPVTIVRLRAGLDVLFARLGQRDGPNVTEPAVREEAEQLDRSMFAHVNVDTSGLGIDEAADEVLREIGGALVAASERPAPAAGISRRDSPEGQLLWVNGPPGVGKSSIAFRAYLDLLQAGRRAAYVDVGQISFCAMAENAAAMRARNLADLWRTFHAAQAGLLVVTGHVATRADADVHERMLRASSFFSVRLRVGDAELKRRVESRRTGGSWPEPGDPLRGCSAAALRAAAERAVAAAHQLELADLGVPLDVEGLDVPRAARALLHRAGWSADGSSSLD